MSIPHAASSAPPRWTDLLGEHEVSPHGSCFSRRDGHEIALFRVEGTVHAIADSCPHAGASLARDALEGLTVLCPAHGLRFDLASGCVPGAAGLAVRTYPVRVLDGRVEVDLGNPRA